MRSTTSPTPKSHQAPPAQRVSSQTSAPPPANIAESPFIVAQRAQIARTFGGAIQRKPNNTGLPHNLKSGVESLSGMSMDAVRVHYNSNKPAQLNALAYAQGTDIHVAPGQERHLPHETWHIVQQAQGRVRPTMQMKSGVPINDDRGLESEADRMGAKALTQCMIDPAIDSSNQLEGNALRFSGTNPIQRKPPDDPGVFEYTDKSERVWSRDLETNAWYRPGENNEKVFWKNQSTTEFLSNRLESPIDENSNYPIPQTIHRFWSGGKLSQDAMKNLMESAVKTKGTNWSNQLWHSSTLESVMDERKLISPEDKELRDLQRQALQLRGYQIRTIEELAEMNPKKPSLLESLMHKKPAPRQSGFMDKSQVKSMADGAATKLQQNQSDKWDGIKHMSDMARLMYLHKVGGHHFDVDMGLGGMDLTRGYYHNDPEGLVPLMGSLAVTGDDPIAQHVQSVQQYGTSSYDFNIPEISDSAGRVADQASGMSHMLNGMIATRCNNPNVAKAIDTLRPDAIHNVAAVSGMIGNEKLLLGDTQRSDLTHQEWTDKKKQTVPPYILDLEHFTSESDNR